MSHVKRGRLVLRRLFLQIGVRFVGVLVMTALLFGVHIRAVDFFGNSQVACLNAVPVLARNWLRS